jgi:amino acid adenylation domain-containing protein
VIPISPGDEHPLSFAQQRMWFLHQYDTDGDVQNNVFYAIELRGPLDVDALRGAFAEIARRHAALRTRFGQRDGVPYQLVDTAANVAVSLTEIGRGELKAAIDAHARHVFDFERGPLWKADLLRLAPDEHVLLVNMHHIVCDGPSFRIVFRELTALYNAAVRGEAAELPPPPVQYTDYARWERQRIEEGQLDADVVYWRERLRGAPDLLPLPTDRPRPAVATHAGGTVPFALSAEIVARLRELRRRENTTLFKTLLAAFQLLMGRYSSQADVVVGAPVSVRSKPEFENVVGFFINTLPLRAQIDPDERFTDLLARVTATVLEAQEHEEIPFDDLVSRLRTQRSLAHNPIVQTVFALQREALSALQLDGITARRLAQDNAAARFDVSLSVYERANDIVGTCEYRTDLFDGATIERLLAHFTRLLEAIVADPQQRVSRYEFLGEEERQRIVVDWNRNRIAVPAEQTMHGLVEMQAATNPDAVALVFEGSQLTYRELDARANQLAHVLIERGVGPDARVGLCIDRSLEQIIGIVGIQKAGGAYVPLDPSYPKERLDYIAQDARAQCVITAEDVRQAMARYPDHAPGVTVLPQNLAYVIYTSGSTGRPKGVMLAHKGAVNLAYAAQQVFGDLPGSRILQFASLSFDTSVWEIVQAWIRGAALVLAPKERMLPGDGLVALMNQERVDRATLPPAALAALDPDSLPQLKVLISAGEALSLAQVTPWLEGRTVFNGYGPTESTVGAAIGRINADEPITIGRPFANINLYILDANLQPVPVGVAGELCIGGVSVARGYLDRPALTAEKFMPSPFGGGRIYRTGDVVRYRPDGKIEFVGRSDHQVKIRGFRIELGEIEATVEQHPAIAKSLVIPMGEGESKRLIAYYTPKPGEEAPVGSELRMLLKQTLPEHMVPSFFIALDAFPLTPNDKIDRAALPAPDIAGTLAEQYAAPRTPIEHTLAGIWQQVLKLPRVGIHDHFFEIGGHSLLVVQVVTRIAQALNVDVAVMDLYRYPTIAALAEHVTRMASETPAETASSPLMTLAGRENGAPLVVIPGIVGVLHGYYDFAQAVGEFRPVYGLHGLSKQELDIRHTVESIAKLYVASLLDVWDRGPFHLLGHSYGGIIAFEMLRQLEQQGHRLGSLILVDADPLALKMKELSPNAFVLRYMLRFLRLDDVAMPETAEALEHADSERLAAVLRDLVARRDPDASLGYEQMDQWVRTIQSRYVDGYAPAPYRPNADVLEIWAEHGAAMRRKDPSAMWHQVLQKSTVRAVAPGDHESVIGREHAARLAQMVNEWIESRGGQGAPLTDKWQADFSRPR